MTDNLIKIIDNLIKDINHDTYHLTDSDINEIEWHLRDVQKLIKEIYSKRGKEIK